MAGDESIYISFIITFIIVNMAKKSEMVKDLCRRWTRDNSSFDLRKLYKVFMIILISNIFLLNIGNAQVPIALHKHYIIAGHVYEVDGHLAIESNITITNLDTSEKLVLITQQGDFVEDLANLHSDFSDGDQISIVAEKNNRFGRIDLTIDLSFPAQKVNISLNQTEIPEFFVNPTVEINMTNNIISSDRNGVIEVMVVNSPLNNVDLNIDLHINVPSDIHVYGDGFEITPAGIFEGYYCAFEVPPGTQEVFHVYFRSEEIGEFNFTLDGLYYPKGNKDFSNSISGDYSLIVTSASSASVSSILYSQNKGILLAILICVIFSIIFGIWRKRKK